MTIESKKLRFTTRQDLEKVMEEHRKWFEENISPLGETQRKEVIAAHLLFKLVETNELLFRLVQHMEARFK